MNNPEEIEARTPPLPDKKYSVIYADPPWAYRQCGTTEKSRGNAAKHYQTMTTEEISALPVHDICAGGGICLLHVGHIPEYWGGHKGFEGVGI